MNAALRSSYQQVGHTSNCPGAIELSMIKAGNSIYSSHGISILDPEGWCSSMYTSSIRANLNSISGAKLLLRPSIHVYMKPKRSRVETKIAVLRAMQRLSKPTNIMSASNTTYTKLKGILGELVAAGLAVKEIHEPTPGKRLRSKYAYTLTDEGIQVLTQYDNALRSMDRFQKKWGKNFRL